MDNLNGVVEHTVNVENVTCEAIMGTNQNIFNSLQWFSVDMKEIAFNTISAQITNNILNFSTVFPYYLVPIHNNSVYMCCTLLDGIIQECRQFLAYIQYTPTTTTITTTSTTTSTTTTTTTTTDSISDIIKSENLINSMSKFSNLEGDAHRLDILATNTISSLQISNTDRN